LETKSLPAFATWAAIVLLTLLSVARIASTYRVFSQTVDEPIHVAAGYQWLHGEYDLDVEHPPLSRLFFGLDAFRTYTMTNLAQNRTLQGNELLYRGGAYRRNLAGARAGNLPFFLLGLLVVFLWAKWLEGMPAGIVAVALFGALPPVLAHAGLATTDMAAAATTAAALYCFARWVDDPSWRRTLVLGLAISAGLLSKFSFLVFFPAGAAVLLVPYLRQRARGRFASQLAGAALLAFFIVCLAYRFETGRFYEIRLKSMPAGTMEAMAARYGKVPGYEWVRPDLVGRYNAFAEYAKTKGKVGIDFVDWAKAAGYPSPLAGRNGDTMRGAPPLPPVHLRARLLSPFRAAWRWVATRVPIPAITFFTGADYVRFHTQSGHAASLFGRFSSSGWWYYFPVVLFFKTPLPFLALAAAGLFFLRRNALAYVPLVLLAVAMSSRINIGVRHILPIYPLLTIAAAVATVVLWRRRRALVVLLLSWYFIGTALAHPNYLAWFNEAAGRHPERIAVDSNLDWGQDLFRLIDYAERQKLSPLYVSYFGSARWQDHLPEARPLPLGQCLPGWIALSEQHPALDHSVSYSWLQQHRPVKKLGSSIRLYFVTGCP
jgi:4-amino-4-deoxy-L-arabinose transferase-like glycosyltransferase